MAERATWTPDLAIYELFADGLSGNAVNGLGGATPRARWSQRKRA